jgi:hypothetical protein
VRRRAYPGTAMKQPRGALDESDPIAQAMAAMAAAQASTAGSALHARATNQQGSASDSSSSDGGGRSLLPPATPQQAGRGGGDGVAARRGAMTTGRKTGRKRIFKPQTFGDAPCAVSEPINQPIMHALLVLLVLVLGALVLVLVLLLQSHTPASRRGTNSSTQQAALTPKMISSVQLSPAVYLALCVWLADLTTWTWIRLPCCRRTAGFHCLSTKTDATAADSCIQLYSIACLWHAACQCSYITWWRACSSSRHTRSGPPRPWQRSRHAFCVCVFLV